MSRRSVQWKRLGVQCDHNADTIRPCSVKGKGRFRAHELENWQIEDALGKVCTRPIGDEKWARIVAVIGTKPEVRTKRRW